MNHHKKKRFLSFFIAVSSSLCVLGTNLSAARAQSTPVSHIAAAPQCHVSLFGTITAITAPAQFILKSPNAGYIRVNHSGATIYSHDLSLTRGTFAGVYGCYSIDRRSFNAEAVTLAVSASAYQAYSQPAAPVQIGPCHESVFGSVTALPRPNAFTIAMLHTGQRLYVDYRGALMRTNGLSIRPGVFTGLYGCFERGETVFKAESVTLAATPQAYATLRIPIVLQGTVDEVHPGMIGVRTAHVGHIHVYSPQSGFRIGETVIVRGAFDPITGALSASSITAR